MSPDKTPIELRFILTGLGNIGRTLLELLISRGDLLPRRYGFRLRCVGVADSSGVAADPAGLDIAAVAALKRAGGRIAALPQFRPDLTAAELAATAEAEVLFEATPTSLTDGEPGLSIVRAALASGKHAILASKGPLVLAYQELAALSDLAGARTAPALRFSGAVGGALPTINIGRRDLAGSRISRAELVVNGTTQVILEQMAEGRSFDAALAEAQSQGIVEPDASLDVDGWDAANKLIILRMQCWSSRRNCTTCMCAAFAICRRRRSGAPGMPAGGSRWSAAPRCVMTAAISLRSGHRCLTPTIHWRGCGAARWDWCTIVMRSVAPVPPAWKMARWARPRRCCAI